MENGTNLDITLSHCAESLREWSRDVFGSIRSWKTRCIARLEGIQKTLYNRPSTFLCNLARELKDDLLELLSQEEQYWLQKSKLNWLTQGERNTRYFHATAVMRNRRMRVTRLKNDRDEWIEDPTELRKLVTRFYRELYQDSDVDPPVNMNLTYPELTIAEKDMLNRPINENEIYSTVSQPGAYKSPGHDGFLPIFYQRNWDIVGQAVVRFISNAFHERRFPSQMNHSYITLVLKVDTPEKVSQFQPISLSNVVVRIISYIIANRLRLVIDKLVSAEQCSFIPGQQASDNVIVAQEILHTMQKNHSKARYDDSKNRLRKSLRPD